MEEFLGIIEKHYAAVLLLVLIFFSIFLVIAWLARVFGWGKFKYLTDGRMEEGNITYIFSRFLVNLIDDFKHLLALVIVIVFIGLIFYSMASTDDFQEKMDALQLVIASLGGLLGSIIGYYFGESAARKSSQGLSLGGSPDTNTMEEIPTPENNDQQTVG